MALSRPASAQEQQVGAAFLKGSAPAIGRAEEKSLEQASLHRDAPLAKNAEGNGGAVHGDEADAAKNPTNPNREPAGDVLWALFACPEFQYIR